MMAVVFVVVGGGGGDREQLLYMGSPIFISIFQEPMYELMPTNVWFNARPCMV